MKNQDFQVKVLEEFSGLKERMRGVETSQADLKENVTKNFKSIWDLYNDHIKSGGHTNWKQFTTLLSIPTAIGIALAYGKDIANKASELIKEITGG